MEGDTKDETNPFFTKTPRNPFDEDDIDELFLKTATGPVLDKYEGSNSKNPFLCDVEIGDTVRSSKREEIESRTVASTERSLARLMESEQIGINIAKDLTHQKEQLENCHTKVDDINSDLRNSQKHLRKIKSFFGGFKDFLMGVKIKSTKATPTVSDADDNSSGRRKLFIQKSRETRGSPGKGLVFSDLEPKTKVDHNIQDKPPKLEDVIDNNLGQMLNHVVGLKSLAIDLGEELDSQNGLIDSLNDKTEEAQDSLTKQNREISKLLK